MQRPDPWDDYCALNVKIYLGEQKLECESNFQNHLIWVKRAAGSVDATWIELENHDRINSTVVTAIIAWLFLPLEMI